MPWKSKQIEAKGACPLSNRLPVYSHNGVRFWKISSLHDHYFLGNHYENTNAHSHTFPGACYYNCVPLFDQHFLIQPDEVSGNRFDQGNVSLETISANESSTPSLFAENRLRNDQTENRQISQIIMSYRLQTVSDGSNYVDVFTKIPPFKLRLRVFQQPQFCLSLPHQTRDSFPKKQRELLSGNKTKRVRLRVNHRRSSRLVSSTSLFLIFRFQIESK